MGYNIKVLSKLIRFRKSSNNIKLDALVTVLLSFQQLSNFDQRLLVVAFRGICWRYICVQIFRNNRVYDKNEGHTHYII